MRTKRLLVCKSPDFKVDYAINPWMKPGTSNPDRAVQQWEQMVATIRETGVAVEVVEFPPNSPQELIWTRDEFILINGTIVLSHFKYDVRKAETPYYQAWFEEQGFKTEQAIGILEGGNIIPHAGRYFIGAGFRGEVHDAEQLAKQLEVEIVPLRVTSDSFFHIDLAFLSVDDHHAFYYPPAFTDDALGRLKSFVANLHEFSEDEMNGYCANSIVIGNNIIMQANNPNFKAKLEALGKRVHEVDVSEFKSIGGGGIHCLTNVLEWE